MLKAEMARSISLRRTLPTPPTKYTLPKVKEGPHNYSKMSPGHAQFRHGIVEAVGFAGDPKVF